MRGRWAELAGGRGDVQADAGRGFDGEARGASDHAKAIGDPRAVGAGMGGWRAGDPEGAGGGSGDAVVIG